MEQNKIGMKAAMVTGATGFIGGNLVGALLQKGYSVTCLVRNTSNTRRLKSLPVRLVEGSLENPDAIRKAASGVDVIYHVAGLTKARDKKQFFHSNATATAKLLETLADTEIAPLRFVHASSLAAAGPSSIGIPRTEEQNPEPVSWYGESKLQSEFEVLKYAGAFPVTILRPSAVYGPGDRDIYMIFRMIQKGCLIAPGRLTRQFSLIHVYDAVSAFIRAGEADTRSGEIYFISNPEIQTWDAVGRAIARELGRKFRSFCFPNWLAFAAGAAGNASYFITGKMPALNLQKVRELLQPSWTCDTSKARKLLGFIPVMGLQSGVRETVRWYRANGWL